MATQLAVYNQALLLLGQRQLSSLTEDREPRYLLDSVWDLGAVDHCLELVRPKFATRTTNLTTSVPTSAHDLDNVFTLPTGYVATVGVYSDAELQEEITRYIIEEGKLACDYATVYLRYVTNTINMSTWNATFAFVVGHYLASQIAIKVDPTKAESLTVLFEERVKAARALEEGRESAKRSPAPTGPLTQQWRHIYNDALLILGLEQITSTTTDVYRRSVLDAALSAGLIEDMLEETGWIFALVSDKITFDPSAEPAWGYTRAHAKPIDLHRLHGIYQDEYMRVPLRLYKDEEQYWFCDLDIIYVQYVNRDWLSTPNSWPAFFRRLVAAKMAKDAAPSLVGEGANVGHANEMYERARHEALANDAVSAPPKIFEHGAWVGSRYRQRYRGRP